MELNPLGNKRNLNIDLLKVICIILVIINHSLQIYKNEFWFRSIIRMAVPLFMMISGYTITKSLERSGVEAYYKSKLCQRLVLYSIPFFIVCIIYILYTLVIGQKKSFGEYIWLFVSTQFGYGAYYYPLLLQLSILFPVLYILIKKLDYKGLLMILFINIIFEIFCSYFNINPYLYKNLVFRYLLFLSFGSWIVLRDFKIKTSFLIISFLLGLFYLLSYTVLGIEWKLFLIEPWREASIPVAFYLLPIFYLFLKIKVPVTKFTLWISTNIAPKTYSIMYTQLMWFWIASHIYEKTPINLISQVFINIVICILSGLIFDKFVNICTTIKRNK